MDTTYNYCPQSEDDEVIFKYWRGIREIYSKEVKLGNLDGDLLD